MDATIALLIIGVLLVRSLCKPGAQNGESNCQCPPVWDKHELPPCPYCGKIRPDLPMGNNDMITDMLIRGDL